MYSLQRACLLFSIWEVTKGPRRICWICFCKYCHKCTPVLYFCGAYCHGKMKLKVTQPSIHMEVPKKAWISFLLMNRSQKPKMWQNIGGLCPGGSCILGGTFKIGHSGELGVRNFWCVSLFLKRLLMSGGIINQPLCLFLLFLPLFPSSSSSVVYQHCWRGSKDGETPVKSSLLHILHVCSYPVFSNPFSKFHSTTESWSQG